MTALSRDLNHEGVGRWSFLVEKRSQFQQTVSGQMRHFEFGKLPPVRESPQNFIFIAWGYFIHSFYYLYLLLGN